MGVCSAAQVESMRISGYEEFIVNVKTCQRGVLLFISLHS